MFLNLLHFQINPLQLQNPIIDIFSLEFNTFFYFHFTSLTLSLHNINFFQGIAIPKISELKIKAL